MLELNKKESEIIFYCKDCAEIVDVIQCGRKYVYKCKRCGTKNVAFGTKKSIFGFFKLEEEDEETPKEEKAEEKGKT